ncbi:MAG: protein kinase, partial [Christensenellaceae bacterium]|nr:protein kinase [Christensenellaceae bacterium]
MTPLAAAVHFCPECGFDNQTYRSMPHQLKPGTMLDGRYLIGRVLGEGGFGITYVGLDTLLELKVAVKEFYMTGVNSRNHMTSDAVQITNGGFTEDFTHNRRRFLDEAQVLARLSGEPGIVMVRDFFEANNTAYIVMEFLSGQTLQSYLERNGKLRWSTTWQLMKPVLESLKRVHAHGIIHRDISP